MIATYCDPTIDIHTGLDIRTIKGLFESHGVPMENSINKREQFASSFHTALAELGDADTPRLQIYGLGCPYLVRSIPLQRYNPKRPLALADHKDDHPVVSVAYFLISRASEEQKSYTPTTQRRWLQPRKLVPTMLGHKNVRKARAG